MYSYKEWYAKNKDKKNAYDKQWRKDNAERVRERQRNRFIRLRLEVLSRDSQGVPRCACCGETENQFLSIDHINGKGKEDRSDTGGNFYMRLKREGFPQGLYQILCYNCNLSKGFYGAC